MIQHMIRSKNLTPNEFRRFILTEITEDELNKLDYQEEIPMIISALRKHYGYVEPDEFPVERWNKLDKGIDRMIDRSSD